MDNLKAIVMSFALSAQTLFDVPASLSEFEEDTSSDEENLQVMSISKKRKLATPIRIVNYMEKTIPGFTATQFQQHFRVNILAYEQLLRIIGPQLMRQSSVGRLTVDVEKQILSVIWILATPDSYSFRSVGERFDLAKSSLSKCFFRVIKVLNSLAPRVIQWPLEGQRLIDIRRKFYNIAKFPNVIGAVDGTFIPIKAPKQDPQSYVTRKCNYAFTLQAIADPFLSFTDVFIGYPGSVSDTRIFKNSDIYREARNNVVRYFPDGDFIIGDKAYPVLPWCVPPYINRGQMTRAQIYFNTVHAKTRQVVERAFALLFGRFRRLKFLDMNRHDLIPATVLAACVLHNMCLNFEDLMVEEYIQEGLNNVIANENDENNAHLIAEEGRNHRNEICRQVYANRNL